MIKSKKTQSYCYILHMNADWSHVLTTKHTEFGLGERQDLEGACRRQKTWNIQISPISVSLKKFKYTFNQCDILIEAKEVQFQQQVSIFLHDNEILL